MIVFVEEGTEHGFCSVKTSQTFNDFQIKCLETQRYMLHSIIMLMYPCLNVGRGVIRGVVILEHRMISRKESRKPRGKMICENAPVMIVCDHPFKTTGRFNSQEGIVPHSITKPPPYLMV
ncbi:hypothetical protein TNCV_262561 [Trichonephila clavipes]|nr:hypothetical protein TNCV_262561 [Trichonephila clavipes]